MSSPVKVTLVVIVQSVVILLLISDGVNSSPTLKDTNVEQIVWFPDPSTHGEDKLIQANLLPKAGSSYKKADLSKVHFYLYTKENPNDPDELFVDDVEALLASHFQPNAKLKIMSHGFGGDIDHPFPWHTKDEVLLIPSSVENNNVILIDWSELAANPDYVGAVVNAKAVAQLVAQMLQFLLEQNVTELQNIHVIGYSLGGQVVGIAGHRFTQSTGLKLPRITGLDPAKPLFEDVDDSERISPDDADFVDIIHTAAGLLGIINPRGSVDFYPNGGTKQPGCGVDVVGSCAHSRAPAFFKESIFSPNPFRSCECADWDEYNNNCACTTTANLGYWIDQRARGKFYLRTNSEAPFAMG